MINAISLPRIFPICLSDSDRSGLPSSSRRPCRDGSACRQKAHDRAAGRRFSGAGLADDADALAPDVEADIGDGRHGVLAEADVQVFDGEDGLHIRTWHGEDPECREAHRLRR